MKLVARTLAALALATCLGIAIPRFTGEATDEGYKTIFAAASVVWFVFAPMSFSRSS